MNLGENIYRLRTEKNMSQGDLADALVVSRQSVSKWENNTAVPELEKLVKMANLFGVTLDELVGGEAEPAAPASSTVPPVTAAAHDRKLTAAQIAGIILLSFGALCFIVFSVVGLFTVGFLLGIMVALPFLLCGAVCLLFRNNIGLLCGWAVYLPIWFICTVMIFRSNGTMAYLVGGGLLLCGIVLTVISIKRMRSGKIHISVVWKGLLITVMIFLQIITFIGMLPPITVELDNPFVSTDINIPTPVEPDGSEELLPD